MCSTLSSYGSSLGEESSGGEQTARAWLSAQLCSLGQLSELRLWMGLSWLLVVQWAWTLGVRRKR